MTNMFYHIFIIFSSSFVQCFYCMQLFSLQTVLKPVRISILTSVKFNFLFVDGSVLHEIQEIIIVCAEWTFFYCIIHVEVRGFFCPFECSLIIELHGAWWLLSFWLLPKLLTVSLITAYHVQKTQLTYTEPSTPYVWFSLELSNNCRLSNKITFWKVFHFSKCSAQSKSIKLLWDKVFENLLLRTTFE